MKARCTVSAPGLPRRRHVLAAAVALACSAAAAQRAGWPELTRIVLPATPGSGADQLLRPLADALAAGLSSSIVIDYRPGAGGLLAAKAVAAAAPDGSTLLLLHSGHVIEQVLTRRIDLLTDLLPVTTFTTSPLMLVVAAPSPHRTLAGLIGAISAAPYALTFGSQGITSPARLGFERLAQQWPGGLRVTHVPYKSPGEPPLAVAAGELDFCLALPLAVQPLVQAGRLRALAISGAQRAPHYPDVPTFVESGMSLVLEPWFALALPHGASPARADRLAQAVRVAVTAPAFVALLARSGAAVELSASPAQFADRLRAELQADAALLARLGIERVEPPTR